MEEGVIIFYPFVNMDAYKIYALKGGNLRKNLNLGNKVCPPHTFGPGVDINRNFPSSFAIIPESQSPCG